MTFIDREDFIALIKAGVSEKVMKLEFDLSEEEYVLLKKLIFIRDELVKALKAKNSQELQNIIKKYGKKDVLVEYVAYFAEDKENEFLARLDSESKERFNSLLEEYEIKLEKPKIRKEKQGKKEVPKEDKKSIKTFSDGEIAILREKAERGNLNQKNIFAFTLFKSGRVDEAREYLMDLIDESKSYTAFRQLIYLEKSEGNYEDAKIWALEADEQFPNNLGIKEVSFRIAREEGNVPEMIQIAKQIKRIKPDDKKYEEEIARIKKDGEEK